MTHIRSEMDTPIGPLTVITTGDTVVLCEFSDRTARIAAHLQKYYADETIQSGPLPTQIEDALTAYFSGDADALNALKVDPRGTEFQRRIWTGLRAIPAGMTNSYSEQAYREDSSPRAVGTANGKNPVAVVLPCHRVIGQNGALTGYAGGLDRKEWLLRHEGAIL